MEVRQFLERAFPDHSIGEKLRQDVQGTLFRGRSLGGGQPVLFAASVAAHPTLDWVSRLETEHAVREDLELPWAARPLALVRAEDRLTLVLEDPGGMPLDSLVGRRFTVPESLHIALGIAGCLSRVHSKGLLHQDIKPANILVDLQSGAVALTGFGLVTRARPTREERGARDPRLGSPDSIAPEPTGGMHPAVDARGDLYGLGLVLYETLTGRLPFAESDPSELLYRHLTGRGAPQPEVNPALLALVSKLVMKLLAKPPEEHYQTALGVHADLRQGLSDWKSQARSEPFTLPRTFVDLTERMRVEAQLRQSQKMEAIASLAGGVAHDFNNLLTAINGYSELAMMGKDSTSSDYEFLRHIRNSGERAAGLTRQLLAFSRKESMQTEVQSLNAIVADAEGMLRRLIEENVELETRLDPEVRCVNVDKGQVEQVLMNLVVNAQEALPNGGRILIETGRVRLEKLTRDTLLNASPGRFVALTVKDTGTGIAPELKAKIFEPFFTTKEVGKGSGLGLAVVYGVMKQLGGDIAVHTEPGEGSSFSVYFPEVREQTHAASDGAERENPESYRGSETILVVEDEVTVRKFIKRALTAQGYRVLEAPNGAQAVRLLEHLEEPLNLVLTDLIMPEMGGRELAQWIRAHRPGLPVLYTSGYAKDTEGSHAPLAKTEPFLPKPFGPVDLARKVREALAHSGPAKE